MRRTLKTAVALLAVSALPLISVAPAAAVEFDRLNFTVDCLLQETNEDNHYIAESETVIITLVNCAGYYLEEQDDTGNATMTGEGVLESIDVEVPAGVVTITITGDVNIDFEDIDGISTDPEFDIDIDVYIADAGVDPDSTLLATEEVTLELTAPETMIREEMIGDPVGDEGNGDIHIGGFETCQVEPGLHVYTTLDFTVLVDGTYDFRAVGVSPADEDLNWGVPEYPSSDPFVAIYSAFDPADPEANVLGCNDDGDDTGFAEIDALWEDVDALETPGGFIIDDQWPWFRTDLEPGDYTLVYMPFSAMGTDDFNIGEFDESSDNSFLSWEPIAQSVTYEMWGPEGGIAFPDELADTGVEPALALWSGLALAGTGVAITVARRRTQRS